METEIAGLNETLEFLMDHLGDSQTSIGRVIGLSQPQVGKRLSGTTPWKYVELLAIADHWGIPITTMLAGKQTAARWLSEQILIVADLRDTDSRWNLAFGSDDLRLFDPDELPVLLDLTGHLPVYVDQNDSLYLLQDAS